MVILSQMFSDYYIYKILVVTACFLIQTGGTPSQMFSDYYLQDPGPKVVLEASFLSGCLTQLANVH